MKWQLYLARFSAVITAAVVVMTGPYVAAQTQPAASLTVLLDKPMHPLPPLFYGLMTEEINFSYEGGLYAELVRNRSFADHGWAGIDHWYTESQGTARTAISYDTTTGPSEAQPNSLMLEVTHADAQNAGGVRNDGWWGVPLRANTTYTGSLFARAGVAGQAPIVVALVDDRSGNVVASATTSILDATWRQYTYTLETGKLTPSATNHLRVSYAATGTLWLDLVSLFPPTYHDRANGNRSDLMDLMAAMHPKFLRMPGGNYLEGDLIDERFNWKLTLGPMVSRPGHRSPWSYQSTDGLGLLEYLEWCEDLHMQPVLAVFAGYALKGDHIAAGPALTP